MISFNPTNILPPDSLSKSEKSSSEKKDKEEKISLDYLRPAEACLSLLSPSNCQHDLSNEKDDAKLLCSFLEKKETYQAHQHACLLSFSLKDLLQDFHERVKDKGPYKLHYSLVGSAVFHALSDDYLNKQGKRMTNRDGLSFTYVRKKLNDIDIRIYFNLTQETFIDINFAIEQYLDCLFEKMISANPPERSYLRKILFKKLYVRHERDLKTGDYFCIASLKGISSVDLEITFVVKAKRQYRFLKESLEIPLNGVLFNGSTTIIPTTLHPNAYEVWHDIFTQTLSVPSYFAPNENDLLIYFSKRARYGDWAKNSVEETRINQEFKQRLQKAELNLSNLISKLIANHHSHPLGTVAFLFNFSHFLLPLVLAPQQITTIWKESISSFKDLQGLPKSYLEEILNGKLSLEKSFQKLGLLALLLLHVNKEKSRLLFNIEALVTSNQDQDYLLLKFIQKNEEAFVFIPAHDMLNSGQLKSLLKQFEWDSLQGCSFDWMPAIRNKSVLAYFYKSVEEALLAEPSKWPSQAGVLLTLLKKQVPTFNPWKHLELAFMYALKQKGQALDVLEEVFGASNKWIEARKAIQQPALFGTAFLIDLLNSCPSEEKSALILELFFKMDPLPSEEEARSVLKCLFSFKSSDEKYNRMLSFMQRLFKNRIFSPKQGLERLVAFTATLIKAKRSFDGVAVKQLFYQALMASSPVEDHEVPKDWPLFLSFLFKSPWLGTENELYTQLIKLNWLKCIEADSLKLETLESEPINPDNLHAAWAFVKQLLMDSKVEEVVNLYYQLQKLKIDPKIFHALLIKFQEDPKLKDTTQQVLEKLPKNLEFFSLSQMTAIDLEKLLYEKIEAGSASAVISLLDYILTSQPALLESEKLRKALLKFFESFSRKSLSVANLHVFTKFFECLKRSSLSKEEVQLGLELLKILLRQKHASQQTELDLLVLKNVQFITSLKDLDKVNYYEIMSLINIKLENAKNHPRLEEMGQLVLEAKCEQLMDKFDDLATLANLQELFAQQSPTRLVFSCCVWKKILQLVKLDPKAEKFKLASSLFWKATSEFKIGRSVPEHIANHTVEIIDTFFQKDASIKENRNAFFILDQWFGPDHLAWHNVLKTHFHQLASMLSAEELLKLYYQHSSLFELCLLTKDPTLVFKLFSSELKKDSCNYYEALFLDACNWKIEDPQFWAQFISMAAQSKSKLIRQQGWKGFHGYLKQTKGEHLKAPSSNLADLLQTIDCHTGSSILDLILDEDLYQFMAKDPSLIIKYLECLTQFFDQKSFVVSGSPSFQALLKVVDIFLNLEINQLSPSLFDKTIELLIYFLSLLCEQQDQRLHYQAYLILKVLFKRYSSSFLKQNSFIETLNQFFSIFSKSTSLPSTAGAETLFDPIFTSPDTLSHSFLQTINIKELFTAYSKIPFKNKDPLDGELSLDIEALKASLKMIAKWIKALLKHHKTGKTSSSPKIQSQLREIIICAFWDGIYSKDIKTGYSCLIKVLCLPELPSILPLQATIKLWENSFQYIINESIQNATHLNAQEKCQRIISLSFKVYPFMVHSIQFERTKSLFGDLIQTLIDIQSDVNGDFLAEELMKGFNKLEEKELGSLAKRSVFQQSPQALKEVVFQGLFSQPVRLQFKTFKPLEPMMDGLYSSFYVEECRLRISDSNTNKAALEELMQTLKFAVQCTCDSSDTFKMVARKCLYFCTEHRIFPEQTLLTWELLIKGEFNSPKTKKDDAVASLKIALEILLEFPNQTLFNEAIALSKKVFSSYSMTMGDLWQLYRHFLAAINRDQLREGQPFPYNSISLLFPLENNQVRFIISGHYENSFIIESICTFIGRLISDLKFVKNEPSTCLRIIEGSLALLNRFLLLPYTSEQYDYFIQQIETLLDACSLISIQDIKIQKNFLDIIYILIMKKPRFDLTEEQQIKIDKIKTIHCEISKSLSSLK